MSIKGLESTPTAAEQESLGDRNRLANLQEFISAPGTAVISDKEIEGQSNYTSGISSQPEIENRYLTFDETNIYPTAFDPEDARAAEGPPSPKLVKYNNPYQWPNTRKEIHMWLCCLGTVVAGYTPGAYLAAADQLEAEFNQSFVVIATGVTIFTGFFAVAPMILAPFSELVGRKPLFTITGIIFVISQLGAGLTQSFAGMMVSRAFGGMASSTFSSMVAGLLSDIYVSKDRNRPMTIFTAGTFAGSGLGPGISSIMVQYVSWRWTWYLQTLTCGLTVLAQIVLLHETRGNVLLSRKAQALNKWYSQREAAGLLPLLSKDESGKIVRTRWKVKADEERASILTMVRISLFRPFHLLVTESIVFWFSAWIAFAWMILYMTFAAIPLIFTTNHDFDLQANGLVFFSIVVASIIFGVVCLYQDKLGNLSPRFRFRDDVPESRLYFACVESALLPVGIFWLAWSQFPSVHWIVPTISIAFMTFGIASVYLAVFNYLADSYGTYASSAIAAQSFCRNILGATIPVYVDQMLEKMTFQGGLSFLGGVAVLLTFVPFVLVIWGPEIRSRSPIAKRINSE